MANEKRLIDADAFRREYCKACSPDVRESCKTDPMCATIIRIVEAPGVDAVEVVHGKWIWDEENECWVCSNCEDSALNNYRGQSVDSNYCPKCGADMRERKEK